MLVVLFAVLNQYRLSITAQHNLLEFTKKCDAKNAALSLERCLNVNAADDEGNTPLIYASANGMLEIVKTLVRKGANINALNASGMSAIQFAAYHDRKDIVDYLIQHGASPEGALFYAISKEHLDLVKWLLDQGVIVNTYEDRKETPLCRAAYRGNVEIVKLLLDHGADVNQVDKNGKTPVKIALEQGHTNVVKLFENLPQYR